MPNKQRHRGKHPQDNLLFCEFCRPHLRAAVRDLSLLLSRDYAGKSALKLVGDRYHLGQRQRLAVERCACADAALRRRRQHRLAPSRCRGRQLLIDGYNLLITIESAFSNGCIFIGRDGCCRDIAGIHGSYKKVRETIPAIMLIGEVLTVLQPAGCTWLLDAPVSNSGRLKKLLQACAAANAWNWTVELHYDPDKMLVAERALAVSSDSWVLDRCHLWLNLAAGIMTTRFPPGRVIDLRSHDTGNNKKTTEL